MAEKKPQTQKKRLPDAQQTASTTAHTKVELTTHLAYPLSSEKAIRMMESQNTLVFVVGLKSTKSQIKDAVSTMFNTRVSRVNTTIGPDGRKKAYIKFAPDVAAVDIATNMGLI